jgi:hypothetical protein
LSPPDGLSAWLTKVDHRETAESPRYIDLPLDFGVGAVGSERPLVVRTWTVDRYASNVDRK